MQVKITSYPASGKVTKDFVFIFAEIFSRRQRGMRLARNIFEAVLRLERTKFNKEAPWPVKSNARLLERTSKRPRARHQAA
jgi:hypothetical protein